MIMINAVKIILMAEQMDRAISFYENIFGLTTQFSSEDWSEMRWGDCIVALHGGHDGADNRVSLSFQVNDIEQAWTQVLHGGGREISPPVKREHEPIIYAEFADPENNIVMMTQYVGGA